MICGYCDEKIKGLIYLDDWEYNILCSDCKEGLQLEDSKYKDEDITK